MIRELENYLPRTVRVALAGLAALGVSALIDRNPQGADANTGNSDECITDFTLRIHDRSNPFGDIAGLRVEVFNTSNPEHRIPVTALYHQPHKPAGDYEPNTPTVRLTGARITAVCEGNVLCPQTEIGAQEMYPDGSKGPASILRVDCPPQQVCKAWGNWNAERPPAPQLVR